VSCIIRNLSGTGACLEIQTTYNIPPEFELRMPNQSVRSCKVIWVRDTRLGVQFQWQISDLPGQKKCAGRPGALTGVGF
jgi:hypothetical protein